MVTSPLLSAWQASFTHEQTPNQVPSTPAVSDTTEPAVSVNSEHHEPSNADGERSSGYTADLDSVLIGNIFSSPSRLLNTHDPTLVTSPATSENTHVTPPATSENVTESATAELILSDADLSPLPTSNSDFTSAASSSSTVQNHPMVTRAKSGIVKPNPKYAFFTVKSNYPEPKTVKSALKDTGWNNAMGDEVDSFHETHT